MKTQLVEASGVRYIVPHSGELLSAMNAGELIGECLGKNITRVLVDEAQLPEKFFRLESLEAGEVFQKFRNYGIALALVVGDERLRGTRFAQVAAEENRGHSVAIFSDRKKAEEWLAAGSAGHGARRGILRSYPVRALLTFLMGEAIYVGIPLLVFADLERFFENPVRMLYAVGMTLLTVYAAIAIPEVGKKRPLPKKLVVRQHIAVILMQVFSLSALVVAPVSDKNGLVLLPDSEALRYLGFIVLVFGFSLMHWTERVLGKQFSVEVSLQEGHVLVTHGPYRYLRHPRYLGVIGMLGGISLLFRSWLGLVLVAGIVVVILWRIRDEERLLREEFQAEWDAYARNTARLIPFLY